MKKTLMLGILVFLLSFAFSCQQGTEVVEQPVVDVEVDIQAIKDAVADFFVASNASEIDRVMSYFADTVIAIPPNEPAAIGKEALRNWLQQFYDEVVPHEDFVVEDVEISGNLAVARVSWSGIFTPKDGSEHRKSNGSMLWVFKKQPDDIWKTIYIIWSNETLVRPTPAE